MQKELYFDISSEQSGGSLYKIKDEANNISFLYQHSTYDDNRDEIKIFDTAYPSFAAFWQMLVKDKQWFYQHPLFVHPEQRDFIKDQLQKVNWSVHPNIKWQESHKQQWKKVLTGKIDYYRSKI
ncbi:MAG: hypothetical protein ABI405_02490 [Parafilimonas sp.]